MIEHAEHESLKRNDTEIAILAPIIEAARDRLGLDAEDGSESWFRTAPSAPR